MKRPEIVVITGASAGVGRAVAREFARRGAHIALLARGIEGLKATAEEVQLAGGKALPISCDVADAKHLSDAAHLVEERFGPIDIWINNAMTTVFGRVTDMSAEEYRRVTDVTYHGMVHGTMAALEVMRPRNRGTIVQVGSALSYRAIPLQSAYCGAKHACRAFTSSLRSELIHDGIDIHLTMVHLPGVNTPQFDWCKSYMDKKAQPVPPIFQPEIAARAIYYAAHHRKREVLVGGSTHKTVWGQKVIPGFLDHFLASKAFEGQLTDEAAPVANPSNLLEPVEGDRGAHGRFDETARKHDALTVLSKRTGAGGMRFGVALAGVAAVSLATLVTASALRRKRGVPLLRA